MLLSVGFHHGAVALGTVTVAGAIASTFITPKDGLYAGLTAQGKRGMLCSKPGALQFFEWGSVMFGGATASSVTFSTLSAGTPKQAGPNGFSHGTIAYDIESRDRRAGRRTRNRRNPSSVSRSTGSGTRMPAPGRKPRPGSRPTTA